MVTFKKSKFNISRAKCFSPGKEEIDKMGTWLNDWNGQNLKDVGKAKATSTICNL
jgi:hypothetical protein